MNIKKRFIKEYFSVKIIFGFAISLTVLFFTLSLFKSNFDFFNDSKKYWSNQITLQINMKNNIDSVSFFNQLNQLNISYFSEDLSYDRNIKNVNYIKGIHDINSNYLMPLFSGDYFYQDELDSENNIVLIGKNLEQLTYKKDNKQYIDIYNKPFEVKGIIGRETSSKYSIYIFMPTATLGKLLSENKSSVYNIEVNKREATEIINKINMKFSDSISNIIPVGTEDNKTLVKAFKLEENIFNNLAIAIFFTITCSITFILLWFKRINRSIAIRLALGANQRDIFIFLFQNSSTMFALAIVISLIAFGFCTNIFKGLTIFPIIVNWEMVLMTIIILYLIIFIIIIALVKKSMKCNIIKLIRSAGNEKKI